MPRCSHSGRPQSVPLYSLSPICPMESRCLRIWCVRPAGSVCVCVCARARARLCTYISVCVHSVHVWSCCVRYTHTRDTTCQKTGTTSHTQKHTYTVCVEMHAACIHMHGHFAHPYVHTYTVYLHTHRRHITQVCACSVYYCCYYDIHPQRKRGHTPSLPPQ